MVSVDDGGKTEQTVANPGSPVIRRDEYGCRSDSNFNGRVQSSSVGTGDVEPGADVCTDLEARYQIVVTSYRYFSFFVSLDLLLVAC